MNVDMCGMYVMEIINRLNLRLKQNLQNMHVAFFFSRTDALESKENFQHRYTIIRLFDCCQYSVNICGMFVSVYEMDIINRQNLKYETELTEYVCEIF